MQDERVFELILSKGPINHKEIKKELGLSDSEVRNSIKTLRGYGCVSICLETDQGAKYDNNCKKIKGNYNYE